MIHYVLPLIIGGRGTGQQTGASQRTWTNRADERSRSDINCFMGHRVDYIARHYPSSEEGENTSLKRSAVAHDILVCNMMDNKDLGDKGQKEKGGGKRKTGRVCRIKESEGIKGYGK